MNNENELIAVFMDYKLENGYWVATTSHEDDTFLGKHLLFHRSWDWLMPVIEKIETIDRLGGVVTITQNHCKIFSRMLGDKTVMSNRGQCYQEANTKLSNTYEAVVEYIKWYNALPVNRLEYLRGELQKECISYGELIELQALAEYIEDGDVELLEAAGVKEGER
jgi:hypothetical protein